MQKLEGKVVDENGKERFEITGKWSEFLNLKDLETGQQREVSRAIPRPAQSERMYNFGYY